MDSTGAVLGPILILPVLIAASTVTEGTYRLIFLLSTIPAFLAVVVILAFVRDKEARSTRKLGEFFKEMRHLGRPFYLLMAVVMVFYIGEISYAFFILRAYDEGFTIGAYSATVSTTMLYILYNVVFVLVAIPAGDLSDKVGRKPVIAFSFSLFAITSALMVSANTLLLLGLGFVMFGVYKGSSEGVFKAYVTDIVPSNLRGTALGAFHTSVGLVMLPGGIVAGLLWDSVGHWATFAYGLATSLVALLLLVVLRVRKAEITQA
jgi:MFS family permease